MTEQAPTERRKVNILEMEIRIWMPMKPGDVSLGKIGNSPVLFQGKTASDVKRHAEEWRQAEWDKHHKKAIAKEANAAVKEAVAE